jgi:ribonuclease BN (tRNA processing enzyme)
MKIKILGSGTVIPAQPVRNCSGYLIDKNLLLDCGPGTWRALAEADLAILEASMTKETKVEGHLTPGLAAKIGQKAGVKRLVITHLFPHVYQTDIEGEVKKEFSGEFSLAGDGMEIEI